MKSQGIDSFPRKRLKYVVSLRRARVDGTEDDRPYVGLENIESWTGRFVSGSDSSNGDTSLLSADGISLSNAFEPGDVLFGKLRPYLAKAWVADFAGRSSTEMLVMQPVDVDSRFLLYVCLSRDFVDAVDASTFGSKMPRAEWDFIGNLLIPLPPLPVQRAIADYLDREVARIDALIAAKERLLGLLAEKRRALITRAVTRGLDPAAPLRDSGVPWLGAIPAHWGVTKLRYLVEFGSGATPDTGKAEFWNGTIPWVSPKDMKQDEIVNSEDHVSELALSVLRTFDPDSVLIVVRGMILAHSFPVALNTVPVTINQDMKALRCCPRILPNYLRDYLRGHEQYIVGLTDSSAHGTRRLETEVLGQIEVALPSLAEQRQIIAYIKAATARFDTACTKVEQSIHLLKERRAALIAAAVTGRIAVEGAG